MFAMSSGEDGVHDLYKYFAIATEGFYANFASDSENTVDVINDAYTQLISCARL